MQKFYLVLFTILFFPIAGFAQTLDEKVYYACQEHFGFVSGLESRGVVLPENTFVAINDLCRPGDVSRTETNQNSNDDLTFVRPTGVINRWESMGAKVYTPEEGKRNPCCKTCYCPDYGPFSGYVIDVNPMMDAFRDELQITRPGSEVGSSLTPLFGQ